MNKIVITHLDNEIMAPATVMVSYENDKATDFTCVYDADESRLGNIYLGYVKDIAKNINAAFIEIEDGIKGYLPLEEAKYAVFANVKNTDKLCQGDKILVQVAKDRIKTKDYALTTKFSLAGRFSCITHGDTRFSISKKIHDESLKESLQTEFEVYSGNSYGLILRTNSQKATVAQIKTEIEELVKKYKDIVNYGVMRPGKTCLYRKENTIVSKVRDYISDSEVTVITDLKAMYDEIKLMKEFYNMTFSLKLYEEDYELYKLYSMTALISEITSKKVWLKSGGYIIIEPTETLTAIDVNTGKYDKGSNKEAALLKINLEAATEIARQLRLRNISGMIIVDFINMQNSDSVSELILHTRQELRKDAVQTNFIDVTKLGLMEITRKKISEPFTIKK